MGLAKTALLKADEVRALLRTARLQPAGGELSLEELLEAIRGSGAAAEEAETLEAENVGGEITGLDELAAAIGTPDEEPSLDEVFSDSRKWCTGKFSIRRELR